MGNLYHINNKGEPGICRAGISSTGTLRGCPFGSQDEHFSSVDEARNGYEAKMGGNNLQILKKDTASSSNGPRTITKARFAYAKAELAYDNAVMSGSASEEDLARLKASKDKAASDVENLSAPTPSPKTDSTVDNSHPQNLAKARFEFQKADQEYNATLATYNDPYQSIPLSTDAVYTAMQKRDRLAAQAGVPTLISQIDAAGAEKRAKRDKDLKILKQLRSSVKSNEVGHGTDRERLYKIEKAFISDHTGDHPIKGSHELRAPAKDVWEVAHSVAKYELDNQSAKLEELNQFSFELSSKKRQQRKNLISNGERMVAFYQDRLDEAEKAIKDPNPAYPYDRPISGDNVSSISRFW